MKRIQGNERRKDKKDRINSEEKRKKKKSNGGSKANLNTSLQNYGDLKWHYTGKSSKFDLPIIKSTYKYINLSHRVDYVLKKEEFNDNLYENKLNRVRVERYADTEEKVRLEIVKDK